MVPRGSQRVGGWVGGLGGSQRGAGRLLSGCGAAGGAALRGGGAASTEQRLQPTRLLRLQQLAAPRPLRPQLHPQVSPCAPPSPLLQRPHPPRDPPHVPKLSQCPHVT